MYRQTGPSADHPGARQWGYLSSFQTLSASQDAAIFLFGFLLLSILVPVVFGTRPIAQLCGPVSLLLDKYKHVLLLWRLECRLRHPVQYVNNLFSESISIWLLLLRCNKNSAITANVCVFFICLVFHCAFDSIRRGKKNNKWWRAEGNYIYACRLCCTQCSSCNVMLVGLSYSRNGMKKPLFLSICVSPSVDREEP